MAEEIQDDLSAGTLQKQEVDSTNYRLQLDHQKLGHRKWAFWVSLGCGIFLILCFIIFEFRILCIVEKTNQHLRSPTIEVSAIPNLAEKTTTPSKPEAISTSEPAPSKQGNYELLTIGWPLFALSSITLIAGSTLLIGIVRFTYLQEADKEKNKSESNGYPPLDFIKQLAELFKSMQGKDGD